MEFKQEISKEDFKQHKEELEQMFSSHGDGGVTIIDSASVFKCLEIFRKTFVGEIGSVEFSEIGDICPYCKDEIETIHLGYYHRILKKCPSCHFITSQSTDD